MFFLYGKAFSEKILISLKMKYVKNMKEFLKDDI